MLKIDGRIEAKDSRVLPGELGSYRKTALTRAVQMDEPFEVHTEEGVMTGQAGDYLCVGQAGEAYPCARAIFEKTYEPADAPLAAAG